VNDKQRWPNRVKEWFRCRPTPPLNLPGPKHIRFTGPREVPSDWYDRPNEVLAQCVICHERVLPGEALKRGLCGPCYLRTNDTPDAA
jgi:hypothetical protein